MLKKIIKFLIFNLILFFALILMGDFASAQEVGQFGINYGADTGLVQTDPRIVIANIIRIFLGFLGIIAVILIIYAGWLIMTAGGEEEKVNKGKDILTKAIIGLIIIVSAFGIASFVLSALSSASQDTSRTPQSESENLDSSRKRSEDSLPEIGEACLTNGLDASCALGECADGLACNSSCVCQKSDLPTVGKSCDSDLAKAACQPGECAGNLICSGTSCLCEIKPIIAWIDPKDGAPDNFATIGGKYFGNQAGKVYFSSDNNSWTEAKLADDPEKGNTECANSVWSDTQIIAIIPTKAKTGPIKIITSEQKEETTADAQGPKIEFTINGVSRPGICKINPEEGVLNNLINYYGIKLSGSTAYFGNQISKVIARNPKFTEEKIGSAEVASIQSGLTSTFVLKDNIASNYLEFTKLDEPDSQSKITYFEPIQGAPGQYVTIYGLKFGASKAASKVYFGETEASYEFPLICADSLWKDNQVIVKVPEGLADGSYAIKINIGSLEINTSLLNPANFKVDKTLKLAPSLCRINPSSGPANTPIELWGEYFGAKEAGKVRFQLNNDQLGSAAAFWGKDSESQGDLKPDKIKTTVHSNAVSGPVKVIQANQIGNSFNFNVNECQANTDCGLGKICCPRGSYKESSCILGQINDCYAEINFSVYEWDFSTKSGGIGDPCAKNSDCIEGLICDPATNTCQPIQTCAGNGVIDMCAISSSCPNSPGECQSLEKKITDQACGDSYCNTAYPECQLNCAYNKNLNKCALNEDFCKNSEPLCLDNNWKFKTLNNFCPEGASQNGDWCIFGSNDSPLSCAGYEENSLSCRSGKWWFIKGSASCPQGFSEETINGSVKCVANNTWQIKVSGRCPDGSFSYRDRYSEGWCVFGEIKEDGYHPLACLAEDQKKFKGDKCLIEENICPAGSLCEADQCTVSESCECCCKVPNTPGPGTDCCLGLTCEAGLCSAGNTAYGLCTGCNVDLDGNPNNITAAEQEASNNACLCQGVSNKYCEINASSYPLGACLSKKSCNSVCDNNFECISGTCSNGQCGGCCTPQSCPDGECVAGECIEKCGDKINNVCAQNRTCSQSGYFCDQSSCLCEKAQACDSSTNPSCQPDNNLCTKQGETCDSSSCLCKPQLVLPGQSCKLAPTKEAPTCNYLGCANSGTGNQCITITGDTICGSCCCGQGDVNPYGLSCKTTEDCVSGEIDPNNQRGLFCGCTEDAQCGANEAVACGTGACCRARPRVESVSPADNSANICRNPFIIITFDQEMDITSFSGNIIVMGNYGSSQCPSGTQYLTKLESKNIFANLINKFIKKINASGENFCAISGAVKGYNNPDQNKGFLTFSPTGALDPNRAYFVIIKGDPDLNNNINEGVLSKYGISMQPTVSQSFNGKVFAGYASSFTTGANICAVEKIDLEPQSYLFKKVFQTKDFYALALSRDSQSLAPIAGLYRWDWNWLSDDSRVAQVNNSNNHSQTVTSQNVKDDKTYIHASIEIKEDKVFNPATFGKKLDSQSIVHVFLCENPWPFSGNLEDWLPWTDASNNCAQELRGQGCDSYNFEFYYCRDAGGVGTEDDLPAILKNSAGQDKIVVRGKSEDFLKEFYFLREDLPELSDVNLRIIDQGEASQQGGVLVALWQQISGVAGYKLYYGLNSGNYDKVIDIPNSNTNTASQRISGLVNNKTYYFALSTYSANGAESAYYKEFSAIPTYKKAPGAPKNLTVSFADEKFSLSWSPASDSDKADTKNYRIYYKAESSCSRSVPPLCYASHLEANQESVKISGLSSGTYYFAITAIDNFNNESFYSSEASASN